MIEGLVASLAILEKKVKELEDDKAAKNIKIKDLENQLRNLSTNPNTNISNLTNVNWEEIVRGNSKLNETQTNILNVVGHEQNQRRRKERNVILFGVPASKAATVDLQIKEDKVTIKEIFTEIRLPNDADSMVSVTRIKPNPSKTTTNPPPLRPTLVDFSYSNRSIEEVLKVAKKLKESVKYNKVFLNKDLTNVELVQLKQLIEIRNDSNKKLKETNTSSSTVATYRYGIRNDRVVKVFFKKD